MLISLTLLTPLDAGVGIGDVSWFLRVACRLASGEVLYRDVFYGAGPIAPYLASLAARISGGEMIAMRALQLLLFAGITVLVLAILHRAGVAPRWQIPVFCALVVYGFEPAFSIYNLFSTVLLLACMATALEWERCGQIRWLWLAGILAGLEIGAKQNVAVLAAIALGLPLLARREWRALLRVAAGFTAASALMAAGVWISGGWTQFVNYGFTNKGKFLATGFPLSASLAVFLSEMREVATWTYKLRVAYSFLAFAVGFICLGLVAVVWLRARKQRGEMNFVAGFAVAALLTIYPISDLSHLAYAIPVLLAAAAMAAHIGFRPRWVYSAAILWFVPAALWIAVSPAFFAATGKTVMMRLPHYWGVLMRTSDYYPLVGKVNALRNAMQAGHLPYLITMDAGFYYLATGLPNPTPFDYPAAPAFGRHGESQVIDALRRRRIPEACLDHEYESFFQAPRVLPPFVRREMRPLGELGACTLYGW